MLRFVELVALFEQAVIATTKPGVQKPHCEPWQSIIACCTALGSRFAAEAFDGDDVRAVELEHELDARIDGAINEPAAIGVWPADEHAARAAVAFAADDLRADEAEHAAQDNRTATETHRGHALRGDGRSPKSARWSSIGESLGSAAWRIGLRREKACRSQPGHTIACEFSIIAESGRNESVNHHKPFTAIN